MRNLLETQLSYTPSVVGRIASAPFIVVGGMGGSALPALILRFLGASPYVAMHRDYDLPEVLPRGARCIAISYSGNTEEALSFAQQALEKKLPLSVITSGGHLLDLALAHSLPYVTIPSGFEPRDAVVALTKALLALIEESDLLPSHATFDREAAERAGSELADVLAGSVPVFYSSGEDEALSYIAKIQCNETAKIPAFSNVFPEINHNEMQSYGSGLSARPLHDALVAVFLEDGSDDPRIKHRMELTEQLLREQGMRVVSLRLPSTTRAETFLYGWWMIRTAARLLAERYDVVPDETPLIAAFKKAL